jgi:hypothetical protein
METQPAWQYHDCADGFVAIIPCFMQPIALYKTKFALSRVLGENSGIAPMLELD